MLLIASCSIRPRGVRRPAARPGSRRRSPRSPRRPEAGARRTPLGRPGRRPTSSAAPRAAAGSQVRAGRTGEPAGQCGATSATKETGPAAAARDSAQRRGDQASTSRAHRHPEGGGRVVAQLHHASGAGRPPRHRHSSARPHGQQGPACAQPRPSRLPVSQSTARAASISGARVSSQPLTPVRIAATPMPTSTSR